MKSVHLVGFIIKKFVTMLLSRTVMELEFYPGPARKLSTNLYDIYHC